VDLKIDPPIEPPRADEAIRAIETSASQRRSTRNLNLKLVRGNRMSLFSDEL
jgi:hypothetical protein